MAEWLILRMPRAADATAGWLIADSEGRPLAAVETGPLQAAAPAANNRRVAVLVPAAEVLSLDVELPTGSGARAARLVAFALEEQLASDVETQHFAIGRSSVPGRTAVAVVTRALLEEWLANLSAAGIKPDVLCTDAALMPRLTGHAVALLENDTLSFTDAEDDAQLTLSAPPGGFAAALNIAFGEELASTHLLFHANRLDWQRRSSEIEASRSSLASLKVQLLGTGALPWLAAQLPNAQADQFTAGGVRAADFILCRLGALALGGGAGGSGAAAARGRAKLLALAAQSERKGSGSGDYRDCRPGVGRQRRDRSARV